MAEAAVGASGTGPGVGPGEGPAERAVAAAGRFAFNRERMPLFHSAGPRQIDRERHVARRDGLSALGKPRLELGWPPPLDDRQFHRE